MRNYSFKISLIALVVLFSLVTFYVSKSFFKKPPYNILIVSTCSLSHNRIKGLGTEGLASMPSLEKFMSQAFVLKNAVTDASWSNVSGFLVDLHQEDLVQNNYKAVGTPWTELELEWQSVKDRLPPAYFFRYPITNRYARGLKQTRYKDDLINIKNTILNKKNWPFVLEVHNKIIHLPYVKTYNRALISDADQEYMKKAIEELNIHPERVLFTMFYAKKSEDYLNKLKKILNQKDFTIERDGVSIDPLFVGFINNKKLIDLWKKSPMYNKDIELLKRVYNSQLELYDQNTLKQILNLYGDKEAQERTVIIFTGDHGEAFGEHGYMIHAETVYDEMIKFPFMVKFPGQTEQIIIEDQFHQKGIFELTKLLLEGKLNEGNFYSKIFSDKEKYKYVYSRNCNYTKRSLRVENKWKYIENFIDESKELYNLIEDPNERNNVAELYPEIINELEGKIDVQKKLQKMNKMKHTCIEIN